MKLRHRFLLVSFGVVIFILATPVIVLYALGYKYDFQGNQVVKTGSLVVKSEPEKSEIYIDNVMHRRKTNATIRFLLPGDYNIEVKKEGYQPWTKRLSILSELVTWANLERDFITLFYHSAQQIKSTDISQAVLNENYSSAVVSTETAISTFNPNRDDLQDLNRAPLALTPPTEFSDPYAMYYLLRFPAMRAFPVGQIAEARHTEANDAYALILSGTTLSQAKNSVVTQIAENVSGFTLENEHLWFIQENILKHANLDLGVIENIATIPYAPSSSKIIRGGSNIFLVLDQTLYAFDNEAKEVYRGVSQAYWDSWSNRLVISNNNEVSLYDPGSDRTELVIRSSTAVSNPILNNRTGYLFFKNEGKVKAIELDGRDHRNVYTIIDLVEGQFLLNNEGDRLHTFRNGLLSTLEIR